MDIIESGLEKDILFIPMSDLSSYLSSRIFVTELAWLVYSCIGSCTPVIVRKGSLADRESQCIMKYLKDDYPLYYSEYKELMKVNMVEVVRAHEYLKEIDIPDMKDFCTELYNNMRYKHRSKRE
jgi:hypothetical protein